MDVDTRLLRYFAAVAAEENLTTRRNGCLSPSRR
jgi:hypothetical protein